jgi:hypothetical protein
MKEGAQVNRVPVHFMSVYLHAAMSGNDAVDGSSTGA